MSRRTKLGILITVLVAGVAGIVALSAAKKNSRAIEARLEAVGTRDLVSVVTASGKIQAKTKVDISSDITGRITRINVREGDLVKKGQLLIQIDPTQYESMVQRSEGVLASSMAALVQARTNRDQAKRGLDRALDLQKAGATLISKEAIEQAQQSFDVAQASWEAAKSQVDQAKAGLEEARSSLAKTTLYAPIDGRVTRLAVEAGEVAVPGTFSRETGLLMTISDLSTVLSKVNVDETDVVRLALGDSVSVAIDAFPDTSFTGHVTKIGNSAKLASAAGGSTDRAVDFEVEVTLDRPPTDIRPDLSSTARIVTETRKGSLAIPIIALTVREHQDLPNETKKAPAPAGAPGDTTKKKEREGVFVVRGGIATFLPVKVGIAGEEFFEVLEGLKKGDSIVAGTYQVIRDLKDSTKVKQAKDVTKGKDGEKKN